MRYKVYYIQGEWWSPYAETHSQTFATEISDMLRNQGKTTRINTICTDEANGTPLPPITK